MNKSMDGISKKLPRFSGEIWPTPKQELLLRSALLPATEAFALWQDWHANTDLEKIDAGSARLIPLVYHNLKEYLPEREKILYNGAYKKSWYRNQKLFHIAEEVVKLFQNHSIQPVVLKGGALTSLYYKDYGLRPMDDFDLFIPYEKSIQAGELLEKHGWHREYSRSVSHHREIAHSLGYQKQGGSSIDLHWFVNVQTRKPLSAEDQARFDPFLLGKTLSLTLCKESHLLNTLAHGLWQAPAPTFRWIADAVWLLRESKGNFDWDFFCREATRQHLLPHSLEGLTYLKSFSSKIPEDTLHELTTLNQKYVGLTERRMYEESKNLMRSKGVVQNMLENYKWSSWNQRVDGENKLSLLANTRGFLNYARHYWGLDSFWQLPGLALKKLFHARRRLFEP